VYKRCYYSIKNDNIDYMKGMHVISTRKYPANRKGGRDCLYVYVVLFLFSITYVQSFDILYIVVYHVYFNFQGSVRV